MDSRRAPRALRVLFVANDGTSVGHVARVLAIARALGRRAEAAGFEVASLLATSSEAHHLLADAPFAILRVPAVSSARRAGWSDAARRRVTEGALSGAVDAFAPDLLVVDTFPAGPHGELTRIARRVPRRALVRRHVPPERASAPELADLVDDYQLLIQADDPTRAAGLEGLRPPLRTVPTPPITLAEADEMIDRDAARGELGLPRDARLVLVASGGGGDAATRDAARAALRIVLETGRGAIPVLARGPLDVERDVPEGALVVRAAPIARLLRAFDGAVAAAGYNTAHELAKAGVPAGLFASPRAFDDQAARAARFEQAGLARALAQIDPAAVGAALDWMTRARLPRIEAGGADRAADALLAFVEGA